MNISNKTCHHTLIMLLHYLGKVNSSNFLANLEENANKKILFLKTLSFSAHNLQTYLL